MSTPTASIYVPEAQQEEFARAVELKKELLNLSMSNLFVRTMIDGRILDTKGLNEFTAKENRTSRDKYLVVILG